MANTRIIYRNLWSLGTIIATWSEDPRFPAENTQDDDTTIAWRSASGVVAACYIDIDQGAAIEYDYVALLNHNLTAGATIRLYGADDSAFTSNVVTDAITYNGNNIRAFLAAARTKRYVRIYADDGSNPAGYLQIGTVVVGKYVDLGVGVAADGYQRGHFNYSEFDRSPSMNMFTTQERPALEQFACTWVQLTDIVRGYVDAVLEYCGTYRAFEICLNSAAPNTNTWWAVLMEISLPEYIHVNYWTWSAQIEEHV